MLALCFAEQFERYHHWRVFANGVDGVCMEFDKNCLLETLNEVDGFKHSNMEYKSIKELREYQPKLEELPFLKRIPYQDENEYRIIYVDESETEETNKPINMESNYSPPCSSRAPFVIPAKAGIQSVKRVACDTL